MAREITMDSVKLMGKIQKLHNAVVYMIGKRVDVLEQQRQVTADDKHIKGDTVHFDVGLIDEGYYECIGDVRELLSRIELEPWQIDVQLKMLEVSLGE